MIISIIRCDLWCSMVEMCWNFERRWAFIYVYSANNRDTITMRSTVFTLNFWHPSKIEHKKCFKIGKCFDCWIFSWFTQVYKLDINSVWQKYIGSISNPSLNFDTNGKYLNCKTIKSHILQIKQQEKNNKMFALKKVFRFFINVVNGSRYYKKSNT